MEGSWRGQAKGAAGGAYHKAHVEMFGGRCKCAGGRRILCAQFSRGTKPIRPRHGKGRWSFGQVASGEGGAARSRMDSGEVAGWEGTLAQGVSRQGCRAELRGIDREWVRTHGTGGGNDTG